MRVPPLQSGAAADARASATWGCATRSARRQAREPGREREHLGARAAGTRHRVEELHVRPRVGLHRTRDVAQHDDAPGARLAAAPHLLDRVAAAAPGARQRRPQVELFAARVAARAPARPHRRGQPESPHHDRQLGQLPLVEGGEVGGGQPFLTARDRQQGVGEWTVVRRVAFVRTVARQPEAGVGAGGALPFPADRRGRAASRRRTCAGGGALRSPRESAGSTVPRNTWPKTRSKVSSCSSPVTNVTRATQ